MALSSEGPGWNLLLFRERKNAMNFSRLTAVFFTLVALMIGGASASSAQTTSEGERECNPNLAVAEGNDCGDQDVNGFLTLVGPSGEQVAVYCVDDVYQYSAQLDWIGSASFSGSAFGFECDTQMIVSMFPGYRPVVNTLPTEGWVYNPWSNEAYICEGGTMTTLYGGEAGTPPEHDSEPSTGCNQVP